MVQRDIDPKLTSVPTYKPEIINESIATLLIRENLSGLLFLLAGGLVSLWMDPQNAVAILNSLAILGLGIPFAHELSHALAILASGHLPKFVVEEGKKIGVVRRDGGKLSFGHYLAGPLGGLLLTPLLFMAPHTAPLIVAGFLASAYVNLSALFVAGDAQGIWAKNPDQTAFQVALAQASENEAVPAARPLLGDLKLTRAQVETLLGADAPSGDVAVQILKGLGQSNREETRRALPSVFVRAALGLKDRVLLVALNLLVTLGKAAYEKGPEGGWEDLERRIVSISKKAGPVQSIDGKPAPNVVQLMILDATSSESMVNDAVRIAREAAQTENGNIRGAVIILFSSHIEESFSDAVAELRKLDGVRGLLVLSLSAVSTVDAVGETRVDLSALVPIIQKDVPEGSILRHVVRFVEAILSATSSVQIDLNGMRVQVVSLIWLYFGAVVRVSDSLMMDIRAAVASLQAA